ncbi:hypothetical protein BS17DRAFT_790684 [Gyrodon lividus]|nr:hypothetical protein BS17DRAFT_790684 [Gyrodon lividus]
MRVDNRDRDTKVRDGKTGIRKVRDGNAESPGWEVRGSQCPMKEKSSKVKSKGWDSGFGHRGSELGRMG